MCPASRVPVRDNGGMDPPPDAATQALMRALAEAGSEEEAAAVYLAALVKAGVITEGEAREVKAELAAEHGWKCAS
jgi:hypothetical protein